MSYLELILHLFTKIAKTLQIHFIIKLLPCWARLIAHIMTDSQASVPLNSRVRYGYNQVSILFCSSCSVSPSFILLYSSALLDYTYICHLVVYSGDWKAFVIRKKFLYQWIEISILHEKNDC